MSDHPYSGMRRLTNRDRYCLLDATELDNPTVMCVFGICKDKKEFKSSSSCDDDDDDDDGDFMAFRGVSRRKEVARLF